MEKIKDTIICSICTEISTLPVHGVCCETAKSLQPACLICIRQYCDLNNPPHLRRAKTIKSWSGCGCDLNLNNFSSKDFYRHTLELDKIRNIFGPSKCPHESCGQVFETSAELRRHLNGTVKSSDNFKNCLEAVCKCKHCNLFGKRKIIEGIHYYDEHAMMYCDVCKKNVNWSMIKEHYKTHEKQLDNLDYCIKDNILKENSGYVNFTIHKIN